MARAAGERARGWRGAGLPEPPPGRVVMGGYALTAAPSKRLVAPWSLRVRGLTGRAPSSLHASVVVNPC